MQSRWSPCQSNCLYQYSRRLPWDVSPNSLTRLLEAKRVAGVPILDLTISNPTAVFLDYPHHAIRDEYARLDKFTYKPDPFGHEQARAAIAGLYATRGIPVSIDRLMLTASTSEAYALLFKLFCDPESEILAPLPSYPLFEYLAALESVRVVPYRLGYDGSWFLDGSHLRNQISSRTRAILIVNPNNPTGSFLKQPELAELLGIAEQYGLPLISDEVFMDYSFGETGNRVRSLIGADSVLSFSLDGLSKTAGMPQMKLGWIVINGPPEQVQIARHGLALLLDTYLSVSTPVQSIAPQLLQISADLRQAIKNRTSRNLEHLKTALDGTAAHVLHVEGGWSAIVQLPNTVSEETWVTRLLEEQDVLVQPGYFFDMPSEAYVVVSLITMQEAFDEGIRRLRALMSGL